MPTTRLKEKLSSIVSRQLPEHIRNEYTTFVKFIEAYYEFLEQDGSAQEVIQNSLEYIDVDRSLTSFIEYFLKQYAPDIPRSVLADKRLLVKKIQDLYYSKGTLKAYELLFRLLYNSKPEISFPGDYILKPSDGKWVQRTTIFIKRLAGLSQSIINKGVTLSNSNKSTFLRLKERYPVYELIGNTKVPINDVYEYEFDNSTNVNIEVGDIITTTTFRGVVLSAPTELKIINPGSGFTPGKVYNININGATGIQVKIASVDSNGGILRASILNYGCYYPLNFYYDLVPEINKNLTEKNYIISNSTGPSSTTYTVNIITQAAGIVDNGVIDTVSGQGGEFSYYSGLGLSSETTFALLYFKSSAKIFYPGYYKTTGGFLSDEYKLQDRDFYQPFSYLIKAEQQLSEFKDAVLNIIHPAGLKIHGEYIIQGIFDYNIIAETAFGISLNTILDFQTIQDSLPLFYLTKPVYSTSNSEEVDYYWYMTKPISLNVLPVQDFSWYMTKPVSLNVLPAQDFSWYMTKPVSSTSNSEDELPERNYDKVVANQFQTYVEQGYFYQDDYVLEEVLIDVINTDDSNFLIAVV